MKILFINSDFRHKLEFIYKQRIQQQAFNKRLTMKVEKLHIEEIQTLFQSMQSKDDFLSLLNKAKPFVYGENCKPFELKQISWYLSSKHCKKRYTQFKIKKKSGADRIIHSPVPGLKAIQKTLAFVLQCVYEPHHAAMGFVKERSIVNNARIHVGNNYVYNLDLKDFFPSIDQARVWKCLQLKPFNLNDEFHFKDEAREGISASTGVKEIKTKDGETIKYKFFNIVSSLDYGGDYINIISNEDLKRLKHRVSIEIKENQKPAKGLFARLSEHSGLSFNMNEVQRNLSEDLIEIKDKESKIRHLIIKELSKYINLKEPIQYSNFDRNSRKSLAGIIASLCCTEMEVERKNAAGEWIKEKRNVLPQGAPTSPVLTNIVCQKLDFLLTGVARRFGLKYSRYADDITFSSMHNVYQPGSEFLNELNRIISEQNFHIKESKTRLQKDGYRKEVTGLLVNDKVNVQKRYIKQLRMWLYYWERYGYERASIFFLQQYIADKGHVKNGKPDMANVISGKLDYLKMVRGAEDEMYKKMIEKLNKLLNSEKLESPRQDHLNKVINLIFDKGLDDAMNIFKPLD